MKNDTIRQLQATPKLRGTCPSCQESFPLKEALLFRADAPMPPRVAEWLENQKRELAERSDHLKKRRERASKRAEATSRAVNLGKILEKIAPAFDGFGHASRDCRGLFEPIDYVVFNGLAAKGEVDSIAFLDIKTGGARLKENQQQIRDAVEAGKVELQTYRREVKS